MKMENVCDKQVGKFFGIHISLAGDKVSFFCEAVNNNLNCITAIGPR